MKRARELTDRISGSGCFRTRMFACTSSAKGRACGVINEVLGEHRPDIWVSDLFSAQKNQRAPQWKVCLAHQLRDCQYAIDALDRIFAKGDEEVIIKGFYHPSTTRKNRRCQTQAIPRQFTGKINRDFKFSTTSSGWYPVTKTLGRAN